MDDSDYVKQALLADAAAYECGVCGRIHPVELRCGEMPFHPLALLEHPHLSGRIATVMELTPEEETFLGSERCQGGCNHLGALHTYECCVFCPIPGCGCSDCRCGGCTEAWTRNVVEDATDRERIATGETTT